MMKNLLFFLTIAALFLISCSENDKFNADSAPKLEFAITYDVRYREPYIYARANIPKDYAEYYYCYWMIDEERFNNQSAQKKVSYGEHILKFTLLDLFGDTLNKSDTIRVNEPLKITLLSPIDEYEASITDTIIYKYKVSGVDTWEKLDTLVNILWLNDSVYSWKVKAFTEQETVTSEIRSVCIKK